MRSFTKAVLIVLLTVGAASAQNQVPAVHTGPNPDKTPGLPDAVRAACPSPPPSSIQDVNAKRSDVDAACGAVSLNCSNVNMGCLEANYRILPSSCKAALVQLECAVLGSRPTKKATSP